MKRKTQKEEKNIQQGGGRGRRRETRRFALLPKLTRVRTLTLSISRVEHIKRSSEREIVCDSP
jgi:hypothetical protein